jgi:hypothetical protein
VRRSVARVAVPSRESSTPLPFFLPLVKVDAQTGEFWARAALEVPDTGGEIFDYASSKPYFEALAKRCLEESGGKKEAPLRLMHQLISVGSVLEHQYDDTRREVAIHGTVSEPAILQKMLDGELCGVSMGGKKRYLGYDRQHPQCRRYTAIPDSHSVVDLGAIPGTGITMLNAAGPVEVTQPDGTVEERPLRKMAGSVREFESAVDQAIHASVGERAWSRDIYDTCVIVEQDGQLTRHGLVRNPDGTVTVGATGIPVIVTYVPAIDAADLGTLLADLARDEPDGDEGMANASHALRGLKKIQRLHDCAVDLGAACASEPLANATSAALAAEEGEMTKEEITAIVRETLTSVLTAGDGPLTKAVGTALGLGETDGVLAKAVGAAIGTGTGDSPLAKAIGAGIEAALAPKLDELKKAADAQGDALGKRIDGVEALVKALPEPAKGALLSLAKSADAAAEVENERVLNDLAKSDPIAFTKYMQRQAGAGYRITTHGLEPINPA